MVTYSQRYHFLPLFYIRNTGLTSFIICFASQICLDCRFSQKLPSASLVFGFPTSSAVVLSDFCLHAHLPAFYDITVARLFQRVSKTDFQSCCVIFFSIKLVKLISFPSKLNNLFPISFIFLYHCHRKSSVLYYNVLTFFYMISL